MLEVLRYLGQFLALPVMESALVVASITLATVMIDNPARSSGKKTSCLQLALMK